MQRKRKEHGRPNNLYERDKMFLLPLIVGGVIHDAKNVLTGMAGTLNLLKIAIEKQNKKVIRKLLDMSHIESLLSDVRQLNSLLESLHFAVSPYLKPGDHQPGKSNVGRLAEELRLDFSSRYPNCRLMLHGIRGLPIVRLPDGITRFIINELTQNAVRASSKSKKGCRIRITSQYDKSNRMLKISAADSGVGFPRSLLSQYQLGNFNAGVGVSGKGYGLFIISQIASRLNGQLTVRNLKSGGALVNVFLSVEVENDPREEN